MELNRLRELAGLKKLDEDRLRELAGLKKLDEGFDKDVENFLNNSFGSFGKPGSIEGRSSKNAIEIDSKNLANKKGLEVLFNPTEAGKTGLWYYMANSDSSLFIRTIKPGETEVKTYKFSADEGPEPPTIHVTGANDTLNSLAWEYHSLWDEIGKANGLPAYSYEDKTRTLPEGTRLTIPSVHPVTGKIRKTPKLQPLLNHNVANT